MIISGDGSNITFCKRGFKYHVLMRLIISVLLVLVLSKTFAQEILVEDRYDEFYGIKPAFYFSGKTDFNSNDLNLGIDFGRINSSKNFVYYLSFDLRPYRKRTLVYQQRNIYYQLIEQRYYVGTGAEYMRPLRESRFGVLAQVNINYTWGSYAGTELKPDNGWLLIPRMGFSYRIMERSFIKTGYSFIDSKSNDIEKHRIFISRSNICRR